MGGSLNYDGTDYIMKSATFPTGTNLFSASVISYQKIFANNDLGLDSNKSLWCNIVFNKERKMSTVAIAQSWQTIKGLLENNVTGLTRAAFKQLSIHEQIIEQALFPQTVYAPAKPSVPVLKPVNAKAGKKSDKKTVKVDKK